MNQTLLRVGIENLNQSGSVSYKEILATPISCPGTQFTKQQKSRDFRRSESKVRTHAHAEDLRSELIYR